MDDEIPDPDLGPWREPLDDGEDDGDGECFVALAQHNARGDSRSAAVERWLRLPHHYSLSDYLRETLERHAAAKEETAENRRSR
mgnify:FL=1